MKNKLLRLAELIQEGFSGDLVEVFRSVDPPALTTRIALASEAISCHQRRSETLWLAAGKKRTPEERRAAAQADLAAFLFACLTGDAREHTESAIDAMRTLGREGEADIIRSLAGR